MAETTLRIAVPALPWADIANYLRALGHLNAKGVVLYGIEKTDDYDGLLIPGGWDADPALYGQQNRACEGVNQELDRLQMRSLELFTAAKKPVLGICRGEQMINIFFGGTLIQHIETAADHVYNKELSTDRTHMTRAERGSFLEKLYGERFPTNSSHHQAVDRLGDGLRAVQWSEEGVIEGIEHETLPVWGVQWHPERMCFEHRRADTVDGSRVIDMFLNRCRGGQ